MTRGFSNRLARLGLAMGFVSVAACTQTPPPPPDTRAQDEAAIRQADIDCSAAAQAKDIDKVVACYTEDTVILAPNMAMMTGRDSAKKMFTDMMAMPGFSLGWSPAKVEAARSGDFGYSVGTYKMMMNGPDGKPFTDSGKYATVWKKQADGSWKLAVDMFNTDTPMPPPPPGKSK